MNDDMVVSVRMSPRLLEEVDRLLDALGKNVALFPRGKPSRSEFIRVVLVTGLAQMQLATSPG